MKEHVLSVIGYGGMGSWHARNLREKVPALRVKGAWDVRPEALGKARDDGLLAYGGLEELLADEEVDLVTVATPNNFHRDLVIACLRAGKNVITEKPAAMNADELQDMIAAAQSAGKLFSVHQNRRWDRDYRIARKVLEDGMIGKPYFIESRVLGSRRLLHGWRGHKENGGGMVLDWGVHIIDQMLDMIPAAVVSVDAHLQSIYSKEVEDNIKIFLRFENGVSAMLEMSTNCFVPLPRWHLSCTDGTAVIENWECKGKIIRLKSDKELEWSDDIIYTAAGPTRTMAPRPAFTELRQDLPDVEADWSAYYNNILDVLDGRAELIVRPEQALRALKVIELVFACQAQGHGMPCRI